MKAEIAAIPDAVMDAGREGFASSPHSLLSVLVDAAIVAAILADRASRPQGDMEAAIERCAKVADAHQEKWLEGVAGLPGLAAAAIGAGDIAKAIRALKGEPNV